MPEELRALLEQDLASARAKADLFIRVLASLHVALGLAAALLVHVAWPIVVFWPVAVLYWFVATRVVRALTSRLESDIRARHLVRTSGPVRATWFDSRGGRRWYLDVGDRQLAMWDDVGRLLANMPWGTATYTSSGRLLELRDVDENVIYTRPDRALHEDAVGNLMWFAPTWLFVASLPLAVAFGALLQRLIPRI